VASNFKTLQLVGKEKFCHLYDYIEWRINGLRQQFETCNTLEDMRHYQGRIQELQYMKSCLDKCLEK
jgi:hypothetical protein